MAVTVAEYERADCGRRPVVAAAGVVALGLTGASGGARDRDPATSGAPAPTSRQRTIQNPAFILTSNVNGTDTLDLTMGQMLDPAALQQALTHHGIPALVETGTYCTSDPAPPDPVGAGVLSIQLPGGAAQNAVRVTAGSATPAARNLVARDMKELAAHTVTMINPAAIPSGAELFFGYSPSGGAIFTGLIYTSGYRCSTNP
jgi:hypothetical protein